MEFRFLSLGPRVTIGDDCVVAKTPRLLRWATLGMHGRRVVVDGRRRVVEMETRQGWLFVRRRTFRFAWIKAVTYNYENWSFSSWLSSVHDGFDVFTVGLWLHDGERLALFTFYGEGTVVNDGPWPDAWYQDELAADLSGTQESDSRKLVEAWSRMIGAPVAPA